jgi:hypothetical protein
VGLGSKGLTRWRVPHDCPICISGAAWNLGTDISRLAGFAEPPILENLPICIRGFRRRPGIVKKRDTEKSHAVYCRWCWAEAQAKAAPCATGKRCSWPLLCPESFVALAFKQRSGMQVRANITEFETG